MRAIIALGILSVTTYLYAEDASRVTPEKLKPLQGKWIAQSFESKDGKQDGRGNIIEIVGDTISSPSPNAEDPATIVAIDVTTDPKRIDVKFQRDIGVIVSQAIFKIEGDTLTICSYDGNGDHRPSKFAAKGDRVHVAIYKRHRQ